MHLRFWLLAGCLAAICIITKAFPPGGNLLKAHCGDLTPKNDTSTPNGHDPAGVVSATGETEFKVEASPTTLNVSDAITVTIKKVAEKFKGFLCIVSPEGDTAGTFKPVGKMSGTDASSHTTTVDCTAASSGATATGASHFNSKEEAKPGKRHDHDSATFTWTASGVTAGNYKLRCTVVKDKDHAYKGYEVALTVKAGPGHTTSNKAGTTTQKSSSPRNMASGFNIMAAAIVAVKILSG